MKECEQFPGRLRDLCEGRGLDGRGDPPRYAVDAFRAQNGLWPLGAVTGSETSSGTPVPFTPKSIGVAVICHNYGRYLAEALDSVLAQTRKPDEIVVIDDSSTDDSPEVAAGYSDRGVRYRRVGVKNVHQARRAGFEATHSEALSFLDADDKLGPEYLQLGLAQFTEPRVAVVYSDIEHFGAKTGRSHYSEAYDLGLLQQDNFIHAGSLVRREALEIAQPFSVLIDPLQTQADWFLWRQVLQGNWTARKQRGTYYYRQHQTNWMHEMRRVDSPRRYFDYAGLCHESVTLFIPLSGRREFWPRLAEFLDRQRSPHEQTRLILVDTSRDRAFHADVRQWIAGCDYGDVRHILHSVEESGLADDDRHNGHVRRRVVQAMWRIYDLLPRVAETEYFWILEDDILPPLDVCERLLHGFDARTASVAAPYRSRYHDRYLAWDQQGQEFIAPGEGLQVVGGNGFGYVVLRRSAFRDHVFTRYQEAEDFDVAFYRRLAGSPLVAKVDWSCLCRHGNQAAPGLLRRMLNFGTAVVRHATDGLKKVDDETYEQRLAACANCESCDPLNWVCREKSCGCRLKIKAGWRSESCPLGKWDVVQESSVPSEQLSH